MKVPFLLFFTCLLASFAYAGTSPLPSQTTAPNLDWKSNRDLTSSQFSKYFKDYSAQGYRMTDVDAYPTSSGLRYAMIWVKNTDRRGWAEHRDMTSEAYNKKWTAYKAKNYRPIDIEMYKNNGKWYYAGIWEENKERLTWKSNRNLTGKVYGEQFQERKKAGFRLIDIEVHDTPQGPRYAAIWVQNKGNIQWAQLRNMSRTTYQAEIDKRSAANFRVIDFESYMIKGQEKYAAIWIKKKSGKATIIRSGRNEVSFANYWRQYRDEGYRLIDFERYNTPSGSRYAGVWVENSDRFRWKHKKELDRIVENYLKTNNLKALSAVVMEGDKVRYQRGFGWADQNAGKKAHGRSVYNLASVSKVVGSTLAAKLDKQGRLVDGTPINLDLTLPTRDYISLPASGHTHTLEQLVAHIGCIEGYQNPRAEPSGHFPTAQAASNAISNRATVSGCTVGKSYIYSTHAFTHLGAVLEKVTRRGISRLVEEEIAQKYNLPSLRSMYRNRSLRKDYERVSPYSSSGREINYSNNSWKVLGGGLEGDMVDLAKFARGVRKGTIVNPSTRDYLWTKVTPSVSNNGIGWNINNTGSFAEHGGDGTGTKTYLRVYFGNKTQYVISLASTRKTSTVSLPTLANQIMTKIQ
jgi:CubicO group peptidase (beta-lactamase class C family)